MSTKDKQSTRTVEEMFVELESIMEWFDSDNMQVDQVSDKYSQAVEISKVIRQRLVEIENQVRIIAQETELEQE